MKKRKPDRFVPRPATLVRYHYIMQLYANGKTFAEIAKKADIPTRTIESVTYRLCIYHNAVNIGHLVAILMRKNIIK